MPAEDTAGPEALPSTFELQAAIVAAARASGQPLLDAGRGQPNWLATEPRAGFFRLGELAVAEAAAASPHPLWGEAPPAAGIARRITDALDDDAARLAVPRRGDRLRHRGARVRARRMGARAGAGDPRRRLPDADADAAPPRAGDGALPRRRHRLGPGTARALPRVRHRGRRGGDGLRVQDPAGQPHRQARRRHRHHDADLHAVPPDPGAGELRVPGRRAARRPQRAVPLRRRLPRAAARPDDQGLLRRQPGQPRQPGDPPGEADPAARPRAREAPRPRDRRRHRLRHVRRGLPQHAGRPPPPRHLPALVLQELRRHRQPARLRGRARRHHPRRAARRPAAHVAPGAIRALPLADVGRQLAAVRVRGSSPTAARWRCTTSPGWARPTRCRWRCSPSPT